MIGYYADKLYGDRLKRCYDMAPPRIQQYLVGEMDYVARYLVPGESVLELGCGYGRVMKYLSERAGAVYGIDISAANIESARLFLRRECNCHLAVMDAIRLAFADHSFDHVVCIQNGISAFHVAQKELIRESVRVAKGNGKVYFSSYSPKIWQHRLEWFELQAREGLIGEIDRDRTRDGVIACRDGFVATTITPEQFRGIVMGVPVTFRIEEVDESSLFFILNPAL
ncbi:MAG: class I SAM-dependent methyltransferase [candidate division WOR-3 bacterium]|nr:MAG: class I SAM-dependent methyltransferase [candidate division WOR-3 bacterium]